MTSPPLINDILSVRGHVFSRVSLTLSPASVFTDVQGVVSAALALPTMRTYDINECMRHLAPSAVQRIDDDVVYSMWKTASASLPEVLRSRLLAIDTLVASMSLHFLLIFI